MSIDTQNWTQRWLDVAFWFNVLEVSALAGVTYISNMENYRKFSVSVTFPYVSGCLI